MNLDDARRVAFDTAMAEVDGLKPFHYGLDEERRDAILVHARQDAAHALCNTMVIAKQLDALRVLALLNLGALALVFCAVKDWI